MSTVYKRTYEEPPVNRKEILRYAGVGAPTEQIDRLIDECLLEISGALSLSVCYAEDPISVADGVIDLGFTRVISRDLAKNLSGCERIVLFASTAGFALDRLIRKYSKTSPTKAFLLGAIGDERVEAVCDEFCQELAEKEAAQGCKTRPRFSPGYGDLPLELQRDIFSILSAQKHIGVTLNESLLISPTKSVTAIVGVGER